MNKILLITVGYPYGSGEDFLAGEIKHLSSKGAQLLICPRSFSGVARLLPEEVKLVRRSKCQYWSTVLFGIFYSLFNYRAYYISDLRATIKVEKFKIFRFSRLSYILVYIIQSARFIAWIDLYYKGNIENDLIYTYWMNAEAYGVSILKRKNPKVKTVSRVHGGDLYKERFAGYLPFRDPIIDSLDRVFPISNHGREYLIQEYGKHNSSKILVSRLGVPKSDQLSKDASRTGILIASCSSNDVVKRLPLILETIGNFSNSVSESVTWLHIGIDESYFFRKYGRILALYNNLDCVIPGVVPNAGVTAIYRKYTPDFFINLSASEGVPVSIMEALSCGIPVIATDVGGTSEIVDNSIGALISSKVDIDLIKNEMERVIKFRAEYSSLACQRWHDLCNEEQNYTKYYFDLKKV